MSMPMYVAPEQQMKDRADFARKGIARGRSVVALKYVDGICFVAENRSQALHKISEIYDQIGFAAVGRYNEFESLRIAGIRHADMRGYAYDRSDVTGRGLANTYAQLLGTIFSSGAEKPYEVELFVAELGADSAADQIYRLTYDGSIGDEGPYAVMGGQAETISALIGKQHRIDSGLAESVHLAVSALAQGTRAEGSELGLEELEVAVLDRSRVQTRKFRRLDSVRLAELLSDVSGLTEPDAAIGSATEEVAAEGEAPNSDESQTDTKD